MKSFSASIAALALLLSVSEAKVAQLDVERRNYVPGHGSLKGHPKHPTEPGTPTVPVNNEYRGFGAYFVNVTVGNPPQKASLQLDTGSSDTWFPATGASACNNGQCAHGSIDVTKSKTYHDAGFEFNITYGDGSYALGEYFTDELVIGGGIKLANLTMAVGSNTTIPYGLLGISYPDDEAAIDAEEGPQYPNVAYVMHSQGTIDTVAFSLYLNDADAKQGGSLLFGGIDTEKYTGQLRRMKTLIFPGFDIIGAFMIPLTSVEIHTPKSVNATIKSNGYPYVAWLDSGSTFTTIPNDLADEFFKAAGAIYDPVTEYSSLPCSFGKQYNKVVYRFGFGGPKGAVIEIDLAKLVYDITQGNPGTFPDGPYKGQLQCVLAVDNSSDPYYVFGDSFMQHAYVVHDLVNNETAIAQAKPYAQKSNIIPFDHYGATIPESVSV